MANSESVLEPAWEASGNERESYDRASTNVNCAQEAGGLRDVDCTLSGEKTVCRARGRHANRALAEGAYWLLEGLRERQSPEYNALCREYTPNCRQS